MVREIAEEHEEWNMAHGQAPIDPSMGLINSEIGRGIHSRGMPAATLAPLLLALLPAPVKQAPITRRIGKMVLEIRQDLIDRTVLAINQGKLVEIGDGRLVSSDGKW